MPEWLNSIAKACKCSLQNSSKAVEWFAWLFHFKSFTIWCAFCLLIFALLSWSLCMINRALISLLAVVILQVNFCCLFYRCSIIANVAKSYFQGDKELPIWWIGAKSWSSGEILRCLLCEREQVEPWICSKQPLSVIRNATFIIDLAKLPSKNDIFADDMGVWKHTGSPSQYFQVHKDESGG